MDLQKMTQKILDESGITYDLSNKKEPKKGFVVSVEKKELKIKKEKFNSVFLKEYIQKAKPKNIGAWIHEGFVYLDSVSIFTDKDKAIKIGKNNQEIAIFDLEEKKEIFI